MAAAVELAGVGYRYPGGARALDGASLMVARGECALLLGANGSGKTTLAYLVSGLIPRFFGGVVEGTLRIDGVDSAALTADDFSRTVGLVLQNPDAQLFCGTVAAEMAFSLRSRGLTEARAAERIQATAAALGIAALLDRRLETLSGGERRLAALASVLTFDPPILVLDEPFANLDWCFSRRLAAILASLKRRGKTLLVVEHRAVPELLREADRLVWIEQGRCRHSEPVNGRDRLGSPDFPPPPTPPVPAAGGQSAPVMTVEGLCGEIGDRRLPDNVSLTLRRGEVVALVGKNGAGKSTLLKHLAGLLAPCAGAIRLAGQSRREERPPHPAAAVGLCFQDPNDQFFKPTVREELAAGLGPGAAAGPLIETLAVRLGLATLLDRAPFSLSEGEKKRVAVASILALEPAVLLLDEPTASLDVEGKAALAALVAEEARRGTAVLIATHDLEFARATARRWILLEAGRVRADGAASEIHRRIAAEASGGGDDEAPGEPATRAPRPLHPVVRLAFLAAGIAAVTAARSLAVLGAEALLVGLLMLARRRAGHPALPLRRLGFMAALAGGVGFLFFGFETAVWLFLRLFSLLGLAAVCLGAMSPEETAAALSKLGLPPSVSFLVTAGMRFVPLLEEKIGTIRDAQQARGIDLRPRTGNLRRWAALLFPLLSQAFLLADQLALAIETRGGVGRMRPPPMERLGPGDWMAIAAAASAAALLIYGERGGLG